MIGNTWVFMIVKCGPNYLITVRLRKSITVSIYQESQEVGAGIRVKTYR